MKTFSISLRREQISEFTLDFVIEAPTLEAALKAAHKGRRERFGLAALRFPLGRRAANGGRAWQSQGERHRRLHRRRQWQFTAEDARPIHIPSSPRGGR